MPFLKFTALTTLPLLALATAACGSNAGKEELLADAAINSIDAQIDAEVPQIDAGPNCPAPASDVPGGSFSGDTEDVAALDVVAVFRNRRDVAGQDITHPYQSELQIYFTDYENACGSEESSVRPLGAERYSIILTTNSETQFPGPPPTGTYNFNEQGTMLNNEEVYFSFFGPETQCSANDCNSYCRDDIALGQAGMVTITQITDTQVYGEYDLNNGSVNLGSFVAPLCGSRMEPEEYCCERLTSP